MRTWHLAIALLPHLGLEMEEATSSSAAAAGCWHRVAFGSTTARPTAAAAAAVPCHTAVAATKLGPSLADHAQLQTIFFPAAAPLSLLLLLLLCLVLLLLLLCCLLP